MGAPTAATERMISVPSDSSAPQASRRAAEWKWAPMTHTWGVLCLPGVRYVRLQAQKEASPRAGVAEDESLWGESGVRAACDWVGRKRGALGVRRGQAVAEIWSRLGSLSPIDSDPRALS